MSKKFPRIPHLPWSEGVSCDDKIIASLDGLLGRWVTVSEKLDGGNVAMTRSEFFARSHTGPAVGPYFDYGKAVHARIKSSIPIGVSVFCEYTYAVHSIKYDELPGALFVIAVRNDARDFFWPLDETEALARSLGLPMTPILWQEWMPAHENCLKLITNKFCREESRFGGLREGLVVRASGKIRGSEFQKKTAKWVRANHVPDDEEHWTKRSLEKQKIKDQSRR